MVYLAKYCVFLLIYQQRDVLYKVENIETVSMTYCII